jgi:hypothetical protein
MRRRPAKKTVPLDQVVAPGDLKATAEATPDELLGMAESIYFHTQLEGAHAAALRTLLKETRSLSSRVRRAIVTYKKFAAVADGVAPQDDFEALVVVLPDVAKRIDAAVASLEAEGRPAKDRKLPGFYYVNLRAVHSNPGAQQERILRSRAGWSTTMIARFELLREAGTKPSSEALRKRIDVVKMSLRRARKRAEE